ncbi:MAG: TonB-dependent receptor [Planctomycetota bacterium]|nr:TonB-dependent receptor [Planctomycetota bacterium]
MSKRTFAHAVAILLGTCLFITCVAGVRADAAEEQVSKPRKGGDELLVFEDLPSVVTASRKAQPIRASSMAVSVVTADDIHYGGQTTVPEVLQFVPGVDVLEIDRNRYAAGVRGLHEFFSDRTLTLIDGRNAESPIFGGAEWLRYPLFMEDIERIEVVRGPGGAAWGPNAFNGVINVIKKKPEDALGVLVSSTVDLHGDTYSQARWAAKKDQWSWRTSAGYANRRSSDDVLRRNDFDSRDFMDGASFDGEARRKIGRDTEVSFGAGYNYQDEGGFEFVNLYLNSDLTYQTTRAFARVDHKLSEKISGYVQWSGNYSKNDLPAVQKGSTNENIAEAQVNIEAAKRHNLTIGGNVRWMDLKTEVRRASDTRLFSAPLNETVAGLFGIYRFDATDRLSFEVQGRGDRYSGTQDDWSTRAAAIFSLDEAHRHTLRVSGAKAFRSPLGGLRDTYLQRGAIPAFFPFVPPGLFAITILPNHNLKNEETWALEAGYTGQLSKHLSVRFDAFYQRYEDLIGFKVVNTVSNPFLPVDLITQQPFNGTGADAWGGELEFAYSDKRGKLSAWAAYNDFELDHPEDPIRAYRPAKVKFGFSGRAFLPHEVVLNLNFRYADVTRGDANNNYNAQVLNRLDFSVTKRLYEHYEFSLGVNDLLNASKDPVKGLGNSTFHETPGRTIYLRFQMKF